MPTPSDITTIVPPVSTVTWSATDLPNGITINPETGVLSGSAAEGNYYPTITVTTDWGTTSKKINLFISSVPAYPVFRDNVQIDSVRIKDIQKAVNGGTIEGRFQIGDTVVVPWRNPADDKTYDMPFIFSHFSHNFKNENGDSKYGVGFTSQYVIKDYVFDNSEASNPDSDRRSYGNNRWIHSNIRQYLNKAGFNWYEAQHEYDVQPDIYVNYKGFLDTVPTDLVNMISPVQIKTQTANVDGSVVDTTIDKFFLLSTFEMNFSHTINTASLAHDEIEGEPWQYYSNMNNGALWKSNGNAVSRIKYNITSTSSAGYYWCRSAYFNSSEWGWFISIRGLLTESYAYTTSAYFAPSFVILEI